MVIELNDIENSKLFLDVRKEKLSILLSENTLSVIIGCWCCKKYALSKEDVLLQLSGANSGYLTGYEWLCFAKVYTDIDKPDYVIKNQFKNLVGTDYAEHTFAELKDYLTTMRNTMKAVIDAFELNNNQLIEQCFNPVVENCDFSTLLDYVLNTQVQTNSLPFMNELKFQIELALLRATECHELIAIDTHKIQLKIVELYITRINSGTGTHTTGAIIDEFESETLKEKVAKGAQYKYLLLQEIGVFNLPLFKKPKSLNDRNAIAAMLLNCSVDNAKKMLNNVECSINNKELKQLEIQEFLNKHK